MPQLVMEVPHTLGQAAAIERLKREFEVAKETYQSHISELEEEWTEGTLRFSFRAAGMNISGDLVVEERVVKIHSHLPLPALMFKGVIDQRVREELGKLLS